MRMELWTRAGPREFGLTELQVLIWSMEEYSISFRDRLDGLEVVVGKPFLVVPKRGEQKIAGNCDSERGGVKEGDIQTSA